MYIKLDVYMYMYMYININITIQGLNLLVPIAGFDPLKQREDCYQSTRATYKPPQLDKKNNYLFLWSLCSKWDSNLGPSVCLYLRQGLSPLSRQDWLLTLNFYYNNFNVKIFGTVKNMHLIIEWDKFCDKRFGGGEGEAILCQ